MIPMNEKEIHNIFQTQLMLPGFGMEAQQKLQNARVLVIGAGGLGCPCLQYLAAAGIGTLGICDGDIVAASNLHRQILFSRVDLGRNKAEVARQRLTNIHSHTIIKIYPEYLTNPLAIDLMPQYDIVVDCTDDLHTRFLINDACVLTGRPLVYAAVYRYEAQVAVFNTDSNHFNLRNVLEGPDIEVISCNESGTLGTVTGMAGCIQAMECIKYLADLDGQLKDQWLMCNFMDYNFYKMGIPSSKNNDQNIPASVEEFLSKNYRQACFRSEYISSELTREEFLNKIDKDNVLVIDVRNVGELPVIEDFAYINIPLHKLLEDPGQLDAAKEILLFCHAGIRSLEAMEFLTEVCGFKNVFHLKGGLLKW